MEKHSRCTVFSSVQPSMGILMGQILAERKGEWHMKSIFEKLGGSYTEVNSYQIPNLLVAETPPIGKWGRMRKRYLQE